MTSNSTSLQLSFFKKYTSQSYMHKEIHIKLVFVVLLINQKLKIIQMSIRKRQISCDTRDSMQLFGDE